MTVRALKRLDENLLCAVLRKFPDLLRDRGLVLPDPPDRESLDYDAIRDTCMSGMQAELDDVLFFVSILGNRRAQTGSSGKRGSGSADWTSASTASGAPTSR